MINELRSTSTQHFWCAGVAELADAYGSGPYGLRPMKVQVLSPAPLEALGQSGETGWPFLIGFGKKLEGNNAYKAFAHPIC